MLPICSFYQICIATTAAEIGVRAKLLQRQYEVLIDSSDKEPIFIAQEVDDCVESKNRTAGENSGDGQLDWVRL